MLQGSDEFAAKDGKMISRNYKRSKTHLEEYESNRLVAKTRMLKGSTPHLSSNYDSQALSVTPEDSDKDRMQAGWTRKRLVASRVNH